MNQTDLQGKRVLLVDDDPLVLRIYGRGLAQHGIEVTTAADGLEAIKSLSTNRPDAVVLDLMMPKFSGLDVLKFIRAEPKLAAVPVVVLSNAYVEEVAGTPVMPGAQSALLKYRSTPSVLAEALAQALQPAGAAAASAASAPAVSPQRQVPRPQTTARPRPAPAPEPVPPPPSEAELLKNAREEFLKNAQTTCAGLRAAFQAWSGAKVPNELRLQDFHRRVHLLSAAAGLAQCHRIALLAGVLEGLLFQVMDQPTRANPSVRDTLADGVEYLELLFRQLNPAAPDNLPLVRVLLLDDDAASNRLLLGAFKQSGLAARGAEVPRLAWEWLRQRHFDLVLVNEKLAGTGGDEFARQLRSVPGYESVLVFYLSQNIELNTAADRILAGRGVVAKSCLPMEVAVKVVIGLLKSQAE